MKNIHVLPTDKPSRLHIAKNGDYHYSYENVLHLVSANDKPHNIYITNSEKPKEGDWVFDGENPYKWTSADVEDCLYNPNCDNYKGCKKIILASDTYLIKDDVQAIDDEFLEWFVNNPSCEEVEVKKIELNTDYRSDWKQKFRYKIMIPKEEPKQETLEEAAANLADPSLCKTDNWIAGAKSNAARDYWFKIFKENTLTR
jgi:hypothetical protein